MNFPLSITFVASPWVLITSIVYDSIKTYFVNTFIIIQL